AKSFMKLSWLLLVRVLEEEDDGG
ncbi:hypothetical protein A2U01_0101534, partial [Trifolium medium]|nr:hypothetical protein [Trifolium medium]